MSDEKAYLQELTRKLDESIAKLETLDPDEPVDDDTFEILQEVLEAEHQLRKHHDIGVRFNILKSQLETLFHKVEEEVGFASQQRANAQDPNTLPADEALVYVSLFNAHGNVLYNWQKLLTPKSLFEHSVNRPVYQEQTEIDSMLARKPNQDQHAYLIVAVKKTDIMADAQTTSLRDPQGYPLLRLKQGALKPEKIKAFVHKAHEYIVSKDGILIPF